MGEKNLAAKSPNSAVEVISEDEAWEIANKAAKGDSSALERLGQALDQHPGLVGIGGDLAKHIEGMWIEHIVGKKDLFHREALSRRVSELRTELLGPSPSPVERLLADQIVFCWLQVCDADIRALNMYAEDFTFQEGTYAQER